MITFAEINISVMKFSEVLNLLEQGSCLTREGWNGKGLFVYKQVPCTIENDKIKLLSSMPENAKLILGAKGDDLHFVNQMNIVNQQGIINSWVPSSSDLYADDWKLYDYIAGETSKVD